MNTSTKRALSLLLSAVFLIAALAIFGTFVRPAYDEIQRLRGQLQAQSELVGEQGTAALQVERLLKEYQGSARLGDSLSLALPKDEAMSSLMGQVNALAQLSGLPLQSAAISSMPIRPALGSLSFVRGFGVLRLELRAFGSYAGLKNFLQKLETNVRVMDLVELKIDQAGRTNQDLFVYNLTVDTYYQTK